MLLQIHSLCDFSVALNTRLYCIKCEMLMCFAYLYNPALQLFGRLFFILHFSAPIFVMQWYSYLVARGIPHCQSPLETLHPKDSMFSDKRLKLSIRVPAWKALSLNLGQYFSALCCKQRNGCACLCYIMRGCSKLILPDCWPHSSGPHKAYQRGSSVKTNSLPAMGDQL